MSNLAAAIRATSHSSYCQVELGQQKLRTPVAHHSAAEDAVWNWELALALPAEPTVAASANGSVVCSLAVYDAQTVGEATPLGKCRVSCLWNPRAGALLEACTVLLLTSKRRDCSTTVVCALQQCFLLSPLARAVGQ